MVLANMMVKFIFLIVKHVFHLKFKIVDDQQQPSSTPRVLPPMITDDEDYDDYATTSGSGDSATV